MGQKLLDDLGGKYEEDLSIDVNKLEEECEKHPLLFAKYSFALNEEEANVRRLHQREKVIRSRLIQEFREKHKGTKDDLEAFYRNHPDHKKVKKLRDRAEYNRDILQTAVSAFHARRSMLELIVKRRLYSEPNVSEQQLESYTKDRREKKVEAARKQKNKELKEKKKGDKTK